MYRDVIDVLVIDDDVGILEILKLALEEFSDEGIRVRGVRSSEQVATMQDYKPKVVILDQYLERETPLEALGNVRGKFPKAQILGYSGHPRAKNIGYNEFKQKPVKIQEMITTVYELAKKVPQTGEQPQLYL